MVFFRPRRLCSQEDDRQICEFPGPVNFVASASEGLAAGAMMACIATAMLPEAYEEGGDYAGLFTLLGFLASLFVKLSMEKKEEPGAICNHVCADLGYTVDEHAIIE